eukprot:SAG25_NODE_3849_length_950_cov_1.002350_2_plen_86_part_00
MRRGGVGIMRPTYALQAAAYAQAVEEMEGADVVKCVVVRIGKKPGDWCVLCTGAGEDNGIDHSKNWLRFPYESTCLRSHYLHLHP